MIGTQSRASAFVPRRKARPADTTQGNADARDSGRLGQRDDTAAIPRAKGRNRIDRGWRRAYAAALKVVFRATHPKERRHSEKLWPHAGIVRDDAGRITQFTVHGRPFPLANADLCREHAARFAPVSGATPLATSASMATTPLPPLHLIACGPSISEIDYPALTEATPTHKRMGVNGAIALTCKYGTRFDYYCITDNGFIRHRETLVAHLIAQDLVLFTTPICLWTILQRFPESAIRCRVFLMERVGKQALRPHESYEDVVARSNGEMVQFDTAMPLGFSHDIARGIFPGGTVAFEALQVAAWLGHGDVYLHGLDLGNAAEKPRFYETDDDKLPTMIHRQLEGEILPSFRFSAPILRAKNIRVTNLSMGSALDRTVFPKVDWRMLPCMLSHAAITRAQRRMEQPSDSGGSAPSREGWATKPATA